MIDFITAVANVLFETGRNVNDLFEDNIISKNTFYKYKHRNPNLNTIIKISNYLEVSIDYLFERVDVNNFRPYALEQSAFYYKLTKLIKIQGVSYRQFCKDLNYSKDNINRYKNGVAPSLRTLMEISEYFNCNIDDLLEKC